MKQLIRIMAPSKIRRGHFNSGPLKINQSLVMGPDRVRRQPLNKETSPNKPFELLLTAMFTFGLLKMPGNKLISVHPFVEWRLASPRL